MIRCRTTATVVFRQAAWRVDQLRHVRLNVWDMALIKRQLIDETVIVDENGDRKRMNH